jgi:hypothetical protein
MGAHSPSCLRGFLPLRLDDCNGIVSIIDAYRAIEKKYAEGINDKLETSKYRRRIQLTMSNLALPKIVSQEEWLAARIELLGKEKEATRALDALAAERRRQPMVRIDKGYVFEGKDGSKSLLDLFDGRRQLIVYHFMFDPSWQAGCVGCSMLVDGMGHLAHLHARDTSLVSFPVRR